MSQKILDNKTQSNAFAAYTAAGRILAMVCSFVMPMFLTRFLTKADYGLYSQFYTLFLFLGSIFAFGMHSNLYYYYPKVDADKRKTLIGNTIFILFIFSLVACVFLEIPSLAKIVVTDESLYQYIHLVAICVLFYVPTSILHPLFVIRKDKLISVIFPPLEIILKVILVIVAGLLFGTLRAIFWSIVILQMVFCVATLFYSTRPVRKSNEKWIQPSMIKPQLSYALPFGISVLLATVFRQFDKILCITYISPEEYATYALAFFGIPGIQQIYDSVCEVNLFNMTKTYQEGDLDVTLSQYQNFCTKMFSFTVPLIFIVFIFSKDIIQFLFTEKYISSVPFFQIYIFSFVIGTIGAGTVLRASGKTRYTLRAYLYSLPIYLPTAYIGIRYFGLWGAITAAMLGITLPKLFQISFEKNIMNVKISQYMPWKKMGKILIISIASLIPFAVIHYFLSLNIFICCLLAIIYLLMVYWFEMKNELFLINTDTLLEMKNKFAKKIF